MGITDEHSGGLVFSNGLSRVFHCNHYNAYLQMVVLLSDGIEGCAPRALLQRAAVPLIERQRSAGSTTEALVADFSQRGFGVLIPNGDGQWRTPHSHYGEAAYSYGKPEFNCYFTAGYIEGLTGYETEEVACQRVGDPEDVFTVSAAPSHVPTPLIAPPELSTPPDAVADFSTRVDAATIARGVAELPLRGHPMPEGNGLIDAFGVTLTHHYADYYNQISYETLRGLLNAGIPAEDAKEQFVQAGHICGFFTLGGIMRSPEWAALVQPMCDDREDWIHGIVAVVNCLGWGVWRLEALEPEQTLVFRIYNSYEGVGYRRLYPQTDDRTVSFLALGVAQGIANLLWKIDIRERPELTKDYYVNVFNRTDSRTFAATQTHAIAAGDAFDRIVVQRA